MAAARDKHVRLQQLAGELGRTLSEERDFNHERAKELIGCLADLIDGDVCDECLAIIPVEDGGDIFNPFHEESCSLYGDDGPGSADPRDAKAGRL